MTGGIEEAEYSARTAGVFMQNIKHGRYVGTKYHNGCFAESRACYCKVDCKDIYFEKSIISGSGNCKKLF
jgi:hypothetical protein